MFAIYWQKDIFIKDLIFVYNIYSIPSAFPFYASAGHFICGKTHPSVLLIKKAGGGGDGDGTDTQNKYLKYKFDKPQISQVE